jgi:hypothetical protein
MEALPFLGMGGFVLASLAVGARLLRLAARTRALPETAIGLALVLAGGFGPALVTAAGALHASSPRASAGCWGFGLLVLNFGATALYLFTWRVFHPRSPWAASAVAAGIVLMFGGLVFQAAASGFGRLGLLDPFAYASFCGRAASFGWASASALREHGIARRRAAFGLVDPQVVDRFRLWGIGSGAAFLVFAVNLARNLAGELDPASRVALSTTPALGMVAAVAIALAFFPPAIYRRRFAVRSV